MKKILLLGEGYYHVIKNKQDISKFLHRHDPVLKQISISYFNQSTFKKNIVIILESRYPYLEYLETYNRLVTNENITPQNSIFIISTLYEPRPLIYSYWVPYLTQHYNIPSEIITYINCATSELDKYSPVKLVSSPILGIKFTQNYDDVLGFKPDELYELKTKKTKLFSSLVHRLNASRVLISSALISNFSKKDYEISLGSSSPTHIPTSSQKQFLNRVAASIGGEINFIEKHTPKRFNNQEINVYNHNGSQYLMIDPQLRSCLFEVVHETVGPNDIWMEESVKITSDFFSSTEKSFRHIYNFQIPIFYQKGYYNYFYKTFGFKPFDIIPWKKWDNMDNGYLKALEIVKFLKEFKLKNYQEILYENKNIFIYNAYRIKELNVKSFLVELKMAHNIANTYWEATDLELYINRYK